MRILIIEDEVNSADLLAKELHKISDEIELLDTLGSIRQAVPYLKANNTADLIFMDIKLSDGYSFEIFDRVSVNTPVIFVTAYDTFAIKAFEANSLGYILKPIQPDCLRKALAKYNVVSGYYKNPLTGSSNKKQHIVVRKGQAKSILPLNRIAFFYSEMKMPFAVGFDDQRYFLDQSLSQVAEWVDPKMFFRATRQLIVNVHAIREFRSIEYSKIEVVLIENNWIREPVIVSQFTAPCFRKWTDNL
jgi:DNA-binding LytR/AlgR family response regulator